MNKQLASAVLATFRTSDPEQQRSRLEAFRVHQWEKNFHWLDASGLALYFLRALKAKAIEDAIPAPVLYQLERRQRENVERTRFLFEEFARINAAFTAAGLHYANLKGFTLAPEYCVDLSLRYQTDCDFLMTRPDAERCHDVLKQFGYGIVAANDHVFEFKTDVGHTPHIADLYKARPERSVEIHLCNSTRADRHPELLRRSRKLQLDGGAYPALSREDMFFSQACHLFRHLRSEWTRLSWLLEFRHFILRHREDTALWSAIQRRAIQADDGGLSIGVAVQFSEAVLGEFAPQELTHWSFAQVPSETARWVNRYAHKVALTDFPGNKLYLILEQTLRTDGAPSKVRRRLFPTRAPGPVVVAPSTGLVRRTRAALSRATYFCFRLKFHVMATAEYLVEHWLWSRCSPSSAQPYMPTSCSASTVD